LICRVIDSWRSEKGNALNVTPVIDAIEGRGWRQEIRRELLCKLQQKLLAHALTCRAVPTIFLPGLFKIGVYDADFVHAAASQADAAVGRSGHVSNHPSAGWDRAAQISLQGWVKFSALRMRWGG
jgi:hypothetical protein